MLFRSMMRFYDVTRGAILLDGVDLREHDLAELRRHFAVVLQDPFLFTGTIAENIRLGAAEITEERMVAAARDVNVLEFVQGLAKGFDEPVLERGNSLSTGQKQLVNFARALAYDPRILILDEATSSLDSESEAFIQEGLRYLMRGRTTFVIAHRLSTVRRADQILVLEGGRIIERGTHESLYALAGRYYDLYTKQHGLETNLFLAPGEGDGNKVPTDGDGNGNGTGGGRPGAGAQTAALPEAVRLIRGRQS